MILFVILSCIILSIALLFLLALKLNLSSKIGIMGGLIVGLLAILPVYLLCQYLNIISIITMLLIEFFVILIITICFILYRFFRDPERTPPMESNTLISPSDGTVRYIHKLKKDVIPVSNKKGDEYPLNELTKTDLIREGSYLIGIEMSVLDNHVNRAPIAGKIIFQKASKGKFLSLRTMDAIFENERVTTIIQNGDIKIGVVQIASRLVRRIVSFHQSGADVQQAERIGMIRFGSQVDVIVPKMENIELCVKQGQHVKAGETILAKI